jgi:hypothetical protein
MTAVSLTAEEAAALDVARALAAAGIPVFVAQPDVTNATGFALPRNWQHATPDPRVVDQWRPGMAIAAVMGHGLDVIDVDPRNGGDPASLNGTDTGVLWRGVHPVRRGALLHQVPRGAEALQRAARHRHPGRRPGRVRSRVRVPRAHRPRLENHRHTGGVPVGGDAGSRTLARGRPG